jgi:S-(hydroxymethyl)glutathione dehydrogenase/alcohol dehydrogenase
VDRFLGGFLPIEHFITHNFEGIDQINTAIEAMHSGACLRAVVKY